MAIGSRVDAGQAHAAGEQLLGAQPHEQGEEGEHPAGGMGQDLGQHQHVDFSVRDGRVRRWADCAGRPRGPPRACDEAQPAGASCNPSSPDASVNACFTGALRSVRTGRYDSALHSGLPPHCPSFVRCLPLPPSPLTPSPPSHPRPGRPRAGGAGWAAWPRWWSWGAGRRCVVPDQALERAGGRAAASAARSPPSAMRRRAGPSCR